MRFRSLLAPVLGVLLTTTAGAAGNHESRRYDAQSITIARRIALTEVPGPAPEGVAELRFGEFFKSPAGRYGLEPSARLRSLDGARVRMVGYIVGQDTTSPGRFILAPFRLSLATAADGPADDLPPSAVWVALPPGLERADLPPLPVPVSVIGRLSVGPAEEEHGRVSFARIAMDGDDPRLPDPLEKTPTAESAVVTHAHDNETHRE